MPGSEGLDSSSAGRVGISPSGSTRTRSLLRRRCRVRSLAVRRRMRVCGWFWPCSLPEPRAPRHSCTG
eukprot:3417641-Lingulodinium_polyedra.AAC.1